VTDPETLGIPFGIEGTPKGRSTSSGMASAACCRRAGPGGGGGQSTSVSGGASYGALGANLVLPGHRSTDELVVGMGVASGH
jgi:hypothetical protein